MVWRKLSACCALMREPADTGKGVLGQATRPLFSHIGFSGQSWWCHYDVYIILFVLQSLLHTDTIAAQFSVNTQPNAIYCFMAQLSHTADTNYIRVYIGCARNICRPQGTILENVYFWFSLVFLVGRTVLMSLSAARINDESKKPAIFIRAIPNAIYDIEVGIYIWDQQFKS